MKMLWNFLVIGCLLAVGFAGCVQEDENTGTPTQPYTPPPPPTPSATISYCLNFSNVDVVVESINTKIQWSSVKILVVDETTKERSEIPIPFGNNSNETSNRTIQPYDRVSIPDLMFGHKYTVYLNKNGATLGKVAFTLPKLTISLSVKSYGSEATITVETATLSGATYQANALWKNFILRITDKQSGDVRDTPPPENGTIEKGDSIRLSNLSAKREYVLTIFSKDMKDIYGTVSWSYQTPTISVECNFPNNQSAAITVKQVSQTGIKWNYTEITLTDKTKGEKKTIKYDSSKDETIGVGDVFKISGLTTSSKDSQKYLLVFIDKLTEGEMGRIEWTQPK